MGGLGELTFFPGRIKIGHRYHDAVIWETAGKLSCGYNKHGENGTSRGRRILARDSSGSGTEERQQQQPSRHLSTRMGFSVAEELGEAAELRTENERFGRSRLGKAVFAAAAITT